LNSNLANAARYFRSVQSGNWETLSTWEQSSNGTSWGAANSFPDANPSNNTITILAGHTVIVNSSISLNETIIYGALEVQTGGILNIINDAGDDIDIQSGGVLRVTSSVDYSTSIIYASSANINIATGGKITVGNGGSVGNNYDQFATTATNTWNAGAIFEWNATTAFAFTGAINYFPNAATGIIPIFRITAVSGTPGGTTTSVINGLIEVNTNLTLGGNGLKTFRDGISGIGTLTLNSSSGGYNISASTALISGSVSIILNENLRVLNGVTIPAGANVNISGTSSINKSAGSFLVNGTVDMNSVNISNTTGDLTVNGTLKTGNTNGFSGTAIFSGTINLNTGSTIEYNAAGNQVVNSRSDYKNIKFSNSGFKTLSSGFNPAGAVIITGLAIVEASNFTFGDAGTSLTMDGGRFRMAGTGTKPDITGTYTLTGGVIEFYNSLLTTLAIRSPKTYYNVEVTGTNVGNGLGNIGIASGGSFTVKTGGIFEINQNQLAGPVGSQSVIIESGAIFKCGNPDGLSGGNGTSGYSTSIKSDIETVTFTSGSTIDYSRATLGGNQVITTAHTYPNLILSGAGVKNVTTGTFLLSSASTMEIKSAVGFDAESGTTLNLNSRPVIVRSSASGTASILDLTGVTVLNATDILVERYIPAGRKWRFLSIPTNTSQTIKAAWQEGALNQSANPVPGYGTVITNNSTSWATNGFDSISNGGPSMKSFNSSDSSWVGISNTTSGIANNSGYMVFIRGDRTIKGFAAGNTPTILRTQGGLNYGSHSPISIGDNLRTSIGNPYPSSIDMRTITKSAGVQNVFYLWDPKLSGSYGLGAYQTFTLNGGNYTVTPGGGSYGASGSAENLIRSGAAFFVKGAAGGGGGAVTLMENAKTFDGTAGAVFFTAGKAEALYCNLYAANTTPAMIVDGISVNYDDDYSNDIDKEDAVKIENLSENVALINNHNLLVVERRKMVISDDTLYLKLSGTREQDYKWNLRLDNMDVQGRTGFLIDKYLNTNTNLNLNGETEIDFTIENIPESYASDRFLIVFKQLAAIPLHINLSAVRNINGNVDLNWNVDKETSIKQYELEHSADGINFNVINTETSVFNNNAGAQYTKTDINSLRTANYYRIKATRYGNIVQYSNVIMLDAVKSMFNIYPNPVVGNIINIEFGSMAIGKYGLQLVNSLGQIVFTSTEELSSNSTNKKIALNKSILPGVYSLNIIAPDGKKTLMQVILN